jgi:hypothetical protein
MWFSTINRRLGAEAFAVVIETSLEQIATSGVAIDTSGHHRRIRTNRFSDHFSPDTASTNHCALTRPTEVSNIILCLHLRQTTKPHSRSARWSALGHSRPGPAGRRSSHVRYAPKATVGHQNAIGRDGPDADIRPRLFDHLVGGDKQALRHGKAEPLRSVEIDDKLELGGLFDRKIGWLGAIENLVDEDGRLPELIW